MMLELTSMMSLYTVTPGRNIYDLFELSSTDFLSEFQLTVNLNKSEFCHGTLTFLGHIVGHGQVKPIFAKGQGINDFPVPSNKKQLMRFFGMAGYYRKFCNIFFFYVSFIN